MEAIKPVIERIVASFGEGAVSDTLAAFVARMVVYDHPERFRLDKALDAESTDELVRLATDFLQQKDSPSLETVCMQVAFDSVYFRNHTELEAAITAKRTKLQEIEGDVCSASAASASDFNAMTQVYHQIFQYLTCHAEVDSSDGDDEVLREIAAALESVFPRVGLKAFVSLSQSEKSSQLKELARLILGVRLFNKVAGKGGAGLKNVPELALSQSQNLLGSIQRQLDLVREQCEQYSDVLMCVRLGTAAAEEAGLDDPAKMQRLKDELTNRRQLAAYLKSLAEEVNSDAAAVQASTDAYRHEMEDLKRLVGARSSVPKEQVYPKFSTMASLWLSLQELQRRVNSRSRIYDSLTPFRSSFTAALTLDMVKVARRLKPRGKGRGEVITEGAPPAAAAGASTADEGAATTGDVGGDAKEPETKSGGVEDAAPTPDADGDAPVRLSLESSPEFMQLPLEYQGYCPWTIVRRSGLLLPGDPTLGVVRYRNSNHVFTHEEALVDFMKNPRYYVDGVLAAARRCPELVHLLQLQVHFPEASLPDLVRGDNAWPVAAAPMLEAQDGPPVMRDAATETPTHFVTKRIAPRYDWNEWSLRRKALQLANLRKARTVSQQCNLSHFRRENDTQVYLPRTHGTQTGVSRGTNPPRVHRYITGLRGGTEVHKPGTKPSGAGAGAGAGAGGKKPLASVVRLEFDL